MNVILEITDGSRKDRGKRFDLARSEPDNITVGRSARPSEKHGEPYPHIQLSADDLRLSRWHFMLMFRPPSCYICDMGSTNTTYVNDVKLGRSNKEDMTLKEGDLIKAGRTHVKVHLLPEGPTPHAMLTCVKCGRELKELEGKSPEELKAEDFICAGCRQKKPQPHRWVGEEGARRAEETKQEEPVASERPPVHCHHCGKDLTGPTNKDGRAEEFKDVALYLCEACALADRKEKDTLGDYILLRQLGAGGMGVVYKAWHKPTERLVAIKELLPDKLVDERSLKVFHREISVTHDLLHPNIVRFYDSFTRKKKPYLVTEFLPGGNAEEKMLAQKASFRVEEACRITLEILEGLAFAHTQGIVHRDLKPQNILFAKDGRAKLSDMGLAKSFELAGQSGITHPGDTGGTPLFMAPEQILNFRFVKPPADIYSVGVCLYYFLTGKFPYHFPSDLDLLMGLVGLKKPKHPFAIVLEDDPIPILQRKPDLPKSLAAVIDRCLKKQPEQRFRDGGELRQALEIARAA